MARQVEVEVKALSIGEIQKQAQMRGATLVTKEALAQLMAQARQVGPLLKALDDADRRLFAVELKLRWWQARHVRRVRLAMKQARRQVTG